MTQEIALDHINTDPIAPWIDNYTVTNISGTITITKIPRHQAVRVNKSDVYLPLIDRYIPKKLVGNRK